MNKRDKELLEGFADWAKEFAALVRADEREACAKVCEEREAYDIKIPCPDGIVGCAVFHTIRGSRVRDGVDCAKKIRARGEMK